MHMHTCIHNHKYTIGKKIRIIFTKILVMDKPLRLCRIAQDFNFILVESESEVTQSCPTLCDPMNWSLPGFSVHGIFQARILEWVLLCNF